MKYYSEETKKMYNSEKECADATTAFLAEKEKAEAEAKAKKEKRSERAKEVELAREKMRDAQKNYADVLNQFVKDYGTYHWSTSSVEDLPLCLSLFDML